MKFKLKNWRDFRQLPIGEFKEEQTGRLEEEKPHRYIIDMENISVLV